MAESAKLGVEAGDAASGLHYSLSEIVRRPMFEGLGGTIIGERIFEEIAGIGNSIHTTRVAVTNAVSNTRLPVTQG